jgi:phosphoglycerol transferase
VYVKGMLDNGWYTVNRLLGAPWGLVLYDYPSLHTIHFAIMKGMAVFLRSYAPLMNGYYLLTFPLVAACAVVALRQFRLSYPAAVAGAVLFSITPYHFTLGGIRVLFLSGYYAVPLAVMLAWWAVRTDGDGGEAEPWTRNFRWPWVAGGLLAGAVIALSHIYYVVFSLFIILVAGLWSAVARGKRGHLVSAAAMAAVIVGITLMNHLPVLAYSRASGFSPAAVSRDVGGPMRHGLRMASLLIPSSSHGMRWIAELQNDHADALGSVQVRGGAYLGLVGVGGFIGLLLLFFKASGGRGDPRLRLLAVTNLSLLLLASPGGLGYLFGLGVTPIIRFYSRVCVYIVFLALAASFIWIDRLGARLSGMKYGRALYAAGLLILLVGGAVDQRVPETTPAYEEIREEYAADSAFVARAEEVLPEGAMVFQLPQIPFPEGTNRYRIGPYIPARAYLHSEYLRWSFGAMRGRPGTLWQERTAGKPADQMIESLCLMGYDAIHLIRRGYRDSGNDMVSEISRVLGEHPVEAAGGHVFFTLGGYREELRAGMHADEWETRRAREHLMLLGGSGFDRELEPTARRWYGCSSPCIIRVHNLSDRPVQCALAAFLRAPDATPRRLTIQGPTTEEEVQLGRIQRLVRSITLEPGTNVYTLSTGMDPATEDAPAGAHAFLLFAPKVLRVDWYTASATGNAGDEAVATRS